MKFVASLVIFCGICFGQTKVTSVEGITEYRLSNGLEVLLFPDKTKPMVTVNVTYLVGSRFEGYGETGMAHLLEHMMFKGTEKIPDVKTGLRDHGAENSFNGTTSYDRTNYFETFPATEANLRWALGMEADRMVNARIAQSDLDSEMTVVRSEFEMGENSPMRILEERVMSTAYLWHSYGRSTIGARSDIEHVPVDRLRAFYRKYYQPDNAILVVAGNFDNTKTLGWVEDTFGALPKPSRQLIATYTVEPVQDGERDVTLRRTGGFQALMAAYHIPAGADPDSAALEVLSEIFSAAPSGRLYKSLVESKKAVSAGSDTYQLHDPGVMMFYAQVRKEASLDDAQKTMLDTIAGILKEPPSKDEVERAKTHLLKDIDLELNDTQRVAIGLSEYQSMGDWRLLFLDRDRIQKITTEEVERVAKLYLKDSNRTLGRFVPTDHPDRAEIPAPPNVSAMVKDYKGQAVVAQGEAFDPSPANIDARSVRVTLPDGMKLVLLSKKTRGATVRAILSLHYGDEKSLFGKETAAQITGQMLMRGTTAHNRQQLQDELDKLKAQMMVSASVNNGATVSISTVHEGLAGTLRLAAEVLKQPSFPESDFEQIRQSMIGRIESQRGEPQALAINAMNRHLNNYPAGDPREIPTLDESIDGLKKLTLDDVKKFHGEFYGASHAELAIVGDFDTAEIQKLAAELFGEWKSPSPYTRLSRTWKKLEAVNQVIETPDKANAFFAAGTTMAMDEADPDFPAMDLANSILGGGIQSRLWKRIRETDGLSYTVQSVFYAGAHEKFAQFLAIAISNPLNTAKVEAAFKQEIARAVNSGFTPEEVEQVKKAYLEESVLGRSEDASLARTLARNAQNGWTMAHDAAIETKISKLTAEEVNSVLKRHLDPTMISDFKAGDFKKAAPAQ